MDPVCCESKSWIEGANVYKLARGPDQPFYQVLVDTHEDPNLLVAYFAEENLVAPDEQDTELIVLGFISGSCVYVLLFEYVMLAGVNDSVEDAKRLIDLVQGIPCKINLISFNPHCGSQFKPTRDEKMVELRNIVARAGIVVFLRFSRGDDQMAACGQLGKPGEVQAPLLKVPPKFKHALEASV